jgi:beta-phosphoglucomutase-like phosphatase (HAD superfamily)/dTDP-glucose pyrophosphorylase
MIKQIIFDLDGVIIDSRELHWKSFNRAIEECCPKYLISEEEHIAKYDGLPTRKKLEILTEEKGLPTEMYDKIYEKKQSCTIRTMQEEYKKSSKLCIILDKITRAGIKVSVASNSIRETIIKALHQKGILHYFDHIMSNEDVLRAKPNPEMYYKIMIQSGIPAKNTLILEDSNTGREAVLNSGAHLGVIKDPKDLTYEKIMNYINQIEEKPYESVKWEGGDMNVLIPMAGAGSRFEQAGYTFPKPLIDVRGKPMIQTVVDSLNINANYIFIVQKSHYEKYSLQHTLNLIAPNCKIIQVEGLTEGAACTTLLAKDLINNDRPLLIANSDQYLDWNSNQFMYSMIAHGIDGGILTFQSKHPKWSYAKLDTKGYVCEVAEKKPISDYATVGVYYFKKGSNYVKAAEQMISKNIRTNNEFYVCPVYNECILNEEKIKIFNINSESMWGLGTPEDLEFFLKNHEINIPQGQH